MAHCISKYGLAGWAAPIIGRILIGVLVLGGFWIATSPVLAQTPPSKPSSAGFLKEINRDVWIPFSKAYATGDAEAYLNLHSKDLIRGQGNSREVLTLTQYGTGMRNFFKHVKTDGGKLGITFRFQERIANAEFGSERGFFEFSFTNAKGETRKAYGKFHVFLRKESGTWKILVDYDSNEQNTITEATFNAGTAVDEVATY